MRLHSSRAKIVEVEDRLAKLKVAEVELAKLSGLPSHVPEPKRRRRPPRTEQDDEVRSIVVLIREVLG